MYYLYYLVLRWSSDLCAAIVKLYHMYYLYYFVLRVSSNLCAAHLYYFAALTQILWSIAGPKQLVPATVSRRPPPLKIQWWRSRSRSPSSTTNPPTLLYPHWLHPTYQSFQTWHSKSIFKPTRQGLLSSLAFFIRLPAPPSNFRTDTKIAVIQSRHSSKDYLPLQAIFELTRQTLWSSTALFIRLPAPTSNFDPTRQDMGELTVIPHQITCPSKPFSNLHAKRCEIVLSFLIRLPSPLSHFRSDTTSAGSQSRHSSSYSSFINDSSGIKKIFSASTNASSTAFFASCWERPISKTFLRFGRKYL